MIKQKEARKKKREKQIGNTVGMFPTDHRSSSRFIVLDGKRMEKWPDGARSIAMQSRLKLQVAVPSLT
jgi:1-acyl-sn-glycerol-3-phosphate acyltransferase